MNIEATNPILFEEAFNLMCGERLGFGISRTVYECSLMPGYVVKVEHESGMFQNVMEMLIWRSVVGTKASRWFAECKYISENGRVLIQERTRQPSTTELLGKIPAWFTDVKLDNWGMARSKENGKEFLVCHDYGYNLTIQKGTETTRMKNAEW